MRATAGVDLAARPGEAVLAAAAGRIVFAGRVAGKPVVVVDHGGVRSTYEPVLTTVTVGQQVGTGQRIGRVGGCVALWRELSALGFVGR